MGDRAANRQAIDDVFAEIYEQLRRLAAVVKRNDPSATITPTALVNETWLKLAGSPNFAATSHLHFMRIAARAMRQVLVDAARRRHAQKRGNTPEIQMVTLGTDEPMASAIVTDSDVLALHDALNELAEANERQAEMIQCRFFADLDIDQTAEALGIAKSSVNRDWRAACAWLKTKLRTPNE